MVRLPSIHVHPRRAGPQLARPRRAHRTMSDGIQTIELEYEAGGTRCCGYLALPEGDAGPVPGVLLLHEWWGHDDYVRSRAEQVAELGYAGFAADLYGEGRQADHPDRAGALMNELMGDPALMAERFQAAMDALTGRPEVDGGRVAAAGYCMGGGIALQMARVGVELAAVVSFHGSLETDNPASAGGVHPSLLVCTGADDPFVPAAHVRGLRAEMDAAGAACEIVEYPGVVHAFTNPGATARGERFGLPLRYDEGADQDSWTRMAELLRASF